MSTLLVYFIKGVWDVRNAIKDMVKHHDAMERALRGKQPFKGDKKYEDAMSTLRKQAAKLKKIASNGIGQPQEQVISSSELTNANSRAKALRSMRENLKARDDYESSGRQLLRRIKEVRKEAEIRSKAARELAKQLLRMAELPSISTAFNAMFLEYSQLAQQGAGALSSVASAAKQAERKVQKELTELSIATENMRVNLKTFGVI
ncbi:MAG: hypothetical protein JW819_08700 [Candidatus Krumholzibacteriota bacterium]|nr:hypothetical protein [Candidatus Krumholzibacteriota bacterium]